MTLDPNNYSVTQPGSIADDWFYTYAANGLIHSYFSTTALLGYNDYDFYYASYSLNPGRYDWLWGNDHLVGYYGGITGGFAGNNFNYYGYFGGAYGDYYYANHFGAYYNDTSSALIGYYDGYFGGYYGGYYGGYGYWAGYWYGGWDYTPSAFVWGTIGQFGNGAWTPNYANPLADAEDKSNPIDTDAAMAEYRQTLVDLLTPSAETYGIVSTNVDPAPPIINPITGDIVLDDANATFDPARSALAESNRILDQIVTLSEEQNRQPSGPLNPVTQNIDPSADNTSTSSSSTGSASQSNPSPADFSLADEFSFQNKGGLVSYVPVVTRMKKSWFGFGSAKEVREPGAAFQIGVADNLGWVYFPTSVGGGRATISSLKRAANLWNNSDRKTIFSKLAVETPSLSQTTLQELLDGVRSPLYYDDTSNNIGIFIGGTGMHFSEIGNVERLYNLYQGTKFYYGGVGNPVEVANKTLEGGMGAGWDAILDRAVADIRRVGSISSKNIHIYGFSRGAAMSIELAYRLEKLGITVDFLGLYDPVYAYVLPGQDSWLVDTTREGKAGNYVSKTMPGNVVEATVIYAMNETRTFFSAAKLVDENDEVPSNVTCIGAPGVHSDIGGHWGNNQNIQKLTLQTMIKESGQSLFVFNGIDPDLQKIYNSDYTAYLVMIPVLEEGKDLGRAYKRWKRVKDTSNWIPVTPDKYKEIANRKDWKTWEPGPFGAQSDTGWRENLGNVAYTAPRAIEFLTGLPVTALVPNQPKQDNIPRKLDWVELGLWDTYTGIDSELMERLYKLIVHPDGGWRTGIGEFESIDDYRDVE